MRSKETCYCLIYFDLTHWVQTLQLIEKDSRTIYWAVVWRLSNNLNRRNKQQQQPERCYPTIQVTFLLYSRDMDTFEVGQTPGQRGHGWSRCLLARRLTNFSPISRIYTTKNHPDSWITSWASHRSFSWPSSLQQIV